MSAGWDGCTRAAERGIQKARAKKAGRWTTAERDQLIRIAIGSGALGLRDETPYERRMLLRAENAHNLTEKDLDEVAAVIDDMAARTALVASIRRLVAKEWGEAGVYVSADVHGQTVTVSLRERKKRRGR